MGELKNLFYWSAGHATFLYLLFCLMRNEQEKKNSWRISNSLDILVCSIAQYFYLSFMFDSPCRLFRIWHNLQKYSVIPLHTKKSLKKKIYIYIYIYIYIFCFTINYRVEKFGIRRTVLSNSRIPSTSAQKIALVIEVWLQNSILQHIIIFIFHNSLFFIFLLKVQLPLTLYVYINIYIYIYIYT